MGANGALSPGGDGRVDILYKKGGKVYRAAARNLEPDPEGETWSDQEAAPGAENRPAGAAAGAATGEAEAPPLGDNPFLIWADGACTGNPGPAGIGIVMLDGPRREECSEYLGSGTNNIAELTAIIRALEMAPRDRTVVIHSDSAYALGLLGKNWKAKANQALVERMRTLASEFSDLRLVKVAGHAGIPENERADALAREAVVSRSSRTSSGGPKTSTRPAEPPLPRPPRKLDPLF
jgi:ribonuclease HI